MCNYNRYAYTYCHNQRQILRVCLGTEQILPTCTPPSLLELSPMHYALSSSEAELRVSPPVKLIEFYMAV